VGLDKKLKIIKYVKKGVLFLAFLWTLTITAQSELLSVSVKADMTASVIEVKQNLILSIPDSIQEIELKALKFAGITLSLTTVTSNNLNIAYKENQTEGLNSVLLVLNKGENIKNITVDYTIKIIEDYFYLPLFFTNFPAASSKNDFFKMDIKMPEEQAYTIHFPKVAIEEKIENNAKQIIIEAPALPSLLRMEIFSETKKETTFVDMVDWLVGVIFIIIGFFIWKHRKKLMYG